MTQVLNVGDTIKGYDDSGYEYYMAEVASISESKTSAVVKRKETGGVWNISLKSDGYWRSDCLAGRIEVISKASPQSLAYQDIEVGDTVDGFHTDGSYSYTAQVLLVDKANKAAYVNYCGSWTITLRPDGTWGSDCSLGSIIIKAKKSQELNIGDVIDGYNDDGNKQYTAKVISIKSNEAIVNYCGNWYLNKKPNGSWGSNGYNGYIKIISTNNFVVDGFKIKYTGSLSVGDKIKGCNDDGSFMYEGVIKKVSDNQKSAYVSWDNSPTYTNWRIERNIDGHWGSNNLSGTISVLTKTNPNQKEQEMDTPLKNYSDSKITEPTKSFFKAEVTDERGNLTDMGRALLLQYLLDKNSKDFKADVVDPYLAEKEKASN